MLDLSRQVVFDDCSVGLTVGNWLVMVGCALRRVLHRPGVTVAQAIISSRCTRAAPAGGAFVRDSNGDRTTLGASGRGLSGPSGRDDDVTDGPVSQACANDEAAGAIVGNATLHEHLRRQRYHGMHSL